MNIAIIPARGGSKRIPRKNIKPFCGKPLIAYSIDVAKESGLFGRIVVSTDDAEIAQVAKRYGAEALMRPKALADDFTGTTPVVAHALTCMDLSSVEVVCCIYATAPFLEAHYLQMGLEKLLTCKADFAFSATTFAYPIQRALKRSGDGAAMFYPQFASTRSQDLEEAYHDAGQFYWAKPQTWLIQKAVFSPQSVMVELPRHLVQDIDTMEDWIRAELMYKALKNEKLL
ncbi:MAG: pseudaminic acid cytidylyltransferase [Campylobacterales bacterium]|nr:pseudaminic acid cytidylyltransferase [Campylobacterales bacterium]